MEKIQFSFDEGCDRVRQGKNKIKRILDGLPESPLNYEEYMVVYTTIYDLCVLTNGYYEDKLYSKYREELEEYITSDIIPAIQDKKDEYIMLKEFVKHWKNYKVMGRWMWKFFHYLDRQYVSMRMVPNLEELITISFRDLGYRELNGKARDAVIAFIDREREGEQIDRAVLKKVLDVFVEMGTEDAEYLSYYKQDFEKHMINDTSLYYSRKASSWIMEHSCPNYMIKAEDCLKKERERVSHYLHSSSETNLIAKVQHELLVVYRNQLIDNEQSGCRALLREEKTGDLYRMFRLFHEIPEGLEQMAEIFKQFISDKGKALVQQVEEAASNQSANKEQICFGKRLIELHDKCMEIVRACFSDHKLFAKALEDVFEVFCNKVIAGSPIVEVMAAFCENLIKSESEKLSNEAVEETLEKVARLLVYFHDKDIFIEFHRKNLARRLLFDKSGSKDYDRSFITKLKQKYGSNFTSKMEGMLTDMTLSRENQTSLENWFRSKPNEKPKFDLSVKILTTGFWPIYKSSDLNLPLEMVKGVEGFKKFYEAKTNRRKLTWIYSLGNCHIDGNFEQKRIELIVSTYQASALLLFNDADSLSFSEIKTQLNLSYTDLVRVLHSLSCAKYTILNKEPKTKAISETDSFEFNTKFTDRMRRIRIPLPPADERKKVTEDIVKDRRHHVDAALVRIMKSRKVLGYQHLVSECVELLSKTFKPDIKTIKQRIEDLIAREFLERDSQDNKVFKYLP